MRRKKGKGKQYYLSYDIEAVGKNIKLGKGEGDGNFGGENQDVKKFRVGEEYQVVGIQIHPCVHCFFISLLLPLMKNINHKNLGLVW